MKNVEELIVENEKLIYSLVNYFPFYINKDDLYQAGCLGMIIAYKNFDPSYDIKFTTYAYPYMLGEMKKTISEDKGIKINRKLQILSLKIEKASIYLMQKLMRKPSDEELASYLEVDIDLISQALATPKKLYSIDEPLKEDSKEINLQDTVGIEDKNIDELIMLKEQLKQLDSLDRELIEKRYMEGYTQQEMADYYNMSQVQICRQEKKVFTKLKQKMVA